MFGTLSGKGWLLGEEPSWRDFRIYWIVRLFCVVVALVSNERVTNEYTRAHASTAFIRVHAPRYAMCVRGGHIRMYDTYVDLVV